MEKKYMKEAIKQARKAFKYNDVPVGAVIIKDDKIIAKAYNKREKTKDVTDHAEIIAIRKACRVLNDWRLNGCVMYVTLKPCAMCMGAIQQSRISKVVYGANNIKESHVLNMPSVTMVSENECAELLKNFFQKQRNL